MGRKVNRPAYQKTGDPVKAKMLVVLFVLTGCGGESFTGFVEGDPTALDADAAGSDGGLDATPTSAAGGSSNGAGGEVIEDGGTALGAGGSGGTGGVLTSTGGARPLGSGGGTDACTFVTHRNGVGQTWQDCVPLGTFNESQATKACKASVSVQCVVLDWCSGHTMRGYDVAGMFVAEWGIGGTAGGHVAVGDGKGNFNGSACNGGPGSSTWD